ncbi:hypothetical protein [Herbidospora sp. NBRC 101105]|uniref:hypothetical protein n=1 Tax=Herbidospora sp. NBRC 101105 TaxID=3032195 RepID=UPI0024A2F215|nr:hypothetical protein [Herbidospora sp. NBRC 101105]GLX96824.1 hypothetical protein Hesp01_47740 [Herbidospora sp. NBRC 101105]
MTEMNSAGGGEAVVPVQAAVSADAGSPADVMATPTINVVPAVVPAGTRPPGAEADPETAVRAAVERLAEAPVAAHVEVYEQVLGTLEETLAAVDDRP